MKYLFVISDDQRWNDIEKLLKANKLEKDVDYESFTSIFVSKKSFIEVNKYEKLFLHKTDVDADESGEFLKSLGSFSGDVILFSGGINGYSLEGNILKLNYELFICNFAGYIQNPINIYNLIGGRLKFIEKMRDHFMNNTVELYPFDKIKRIVLEEDYYSQLQKNADTKKMIPIIRDFCVSPKYNKFVEIKNKFSDILAGG